MQTPPAPARRTLLRAMSTGMAGLGAAALGGLFTATAAQTQVQAAPSLADQMNEPGPEARMLQARIGLWDLTETFWPGPTAEPITSTGLIAERVALGTALQELIRPLADTARANVKRTDLLCYNRLDGRWDYVSFDTRAPVGLMPAYSAGRGDLDLIELTFLPFAVIGIVTAGTTDTAGIGQMIRMRQHIISQAADRDRKDQYFTLADGTGTEWLAHRYDYQRRA